MRYFMVAFVVKFENGFDDYDHINSVCLSHKEMPSLEHLKKQIKIALEASPIHPGYTVEKVTILAVTEFSKEDVEKLISESDDVIFVEI